MGKKLTLQGSPQPVFMTRLDAEKGLLGSTCYSVEADSSIGLHVFLGILMLNSWLRTVEGST